MSNDYHYLFAGEPWCGGWFTCEIGVAGHNNINQSVLILSIRRV